MSLMATLSVVGCVCPPAGYYSGMNRGYVPNHIAYGNGCDTGCDPCGPIEACGVAEFDCDPCAPQMYAPPIYASRPYVSNIDCRNTFSNLGNGVLLIGRGILDVTAAPFVIAGSMLSSGCRYEVLAFCDDVPYGSPHYQTVSPCSSACSSGCASCANGYTEGIQYNYNANPMNRTTLQTPPRRNNPVIQASYQEPTAPVRFVQPPR